MITDHEIDALTDALRTLRGQIGWRESLRQLKKAAGCNDEPMQSVAIILVNDFNHLVDGGLRPHLAMRTILS